MNPNLYKAGSPGTPLVSVICRSIGRPQLNQALQSVIEQSYRPLEIILVDSMAKDIAATLPPEIKKQVTSVMPIRQLGRAEAANAGLDHANGHYLMFLDDDDWIEPHHIGGLVTALQNIRGNRAAYCNVRRAAFDGSPLNDVFAFDFDPVLLHSDNFIPIHAVLFERTLLTDGCRFDESFDIYEDWDFWLQVSRFTGFTHLDVISACYRQGGDSDTGVADQRLKFSTDHVLARARAAIYEKWKSLWSGAEINQLVGGLDRSSELLALHETIAGKNSELKALEYAIADQKTEFTKLVDDQQRQREELQVQLETLHQALGYVKQSTADKVARIEADLAHKQDQIRNLGTELAVKTREFQRQRWFLEAHIRQLEQRLDGIYRSFTWRLMGPFRRLGRFLNLSALDPLRRRLHKRRYGTEWQRQNDMVDSPPPGSEATPPIAVSETDIKAHYRQEAERNLDDFISKGRSICFPETEQPRVSILLVLYNQAPLTLLCLESIFQYAPVPYEVVLVDNASSDRTGELLSGLRNVKVISNQDNLGFVRAVNQGARHCRGRNLLLLNNDAILHRSSIESALQTLESVPDAGAVGGRIILLDGTLQEAGSFIFSDGSCLGYGRHQKPDLPEFMFQREVDYCSGAFLLIPSALFAEMNGFDEDYAPAYYEETDFCVRLHQRGLKIVYDPFAVVTHYEFASTGGLDKASKLQTEHRQLLVAKHGSWLAKQPPPGPEPLLRARSANCRRNVLFIDDRIPHKGLGSGYPRSREIILTLASSAVNLTFYPLQFPNDDWPAVYQSIPGKVEVMLDQGTAGLGDFLRGRSDFYDFIIISRIHNMREFQRLLGLERINFDRTRIIYDAEAITASREIRQRELRGEQLDALEKSRMLHDELDAARIADTVLCVSAGEAASFGAAGFNNTLVLGHSLTPRAMTPGVSRRQDLLFVGALIDDESPNVDSLLWFAELVMPILSARVQPLSLHVIGDNSAPALRRISRSDILFHGRQGNLDGFYYRSRVFIAPTRFAAGIPHKVHEAAAQGIPCVTTSLLAEQLGWSNEVHLLTADDPPGFAAACERLYRDDNLWQRISSAAQSRVTADCSPQSFRSTLLTCIGITSPAAADKAVSAAAES